MTHDTKAIHASVKDELLERLNSGEDDDLAITCAILKAIGRGYRLGAHVCAEFYRREIDAAVAAGGLPVIGPIEIRDSGDETDLWAERYGDR